MKLRFVLLMALSAGVNAAQLSALSGVEFLVVNGKNVENYGEQAHKVLALEAGKYQIVARYEASLKRGSKNTLFTSKPYVFDIDVASNDLTLSVPKMRLLSHAKEFFRNPTWQLNDSVTAKQFTITGEELIGSGFGAFSNMEKAVANHNQNTANALANEAIKPLPLPDLLVEKAVIQDANTQQQDAFTQLTLWYRDATNEEKKAFKRWIIDNDD